MKGALAWWAMLLVVLCALVGGVKWTVQIRPYERMKVQTANLPLGTTLQQAKTQIDRKPEISCSAVTECKQKVAYYYKRYKPNPVQKVRGPLLVYRMAGIDHLHCLYFDEQNRLVSVSESTLQIP
jgi:hypothetical protein